MKKKAYHFLLGVFFVIAVVAIQGSYSEEYVRGTGNYLRRSSQISQITTTVAAWQDVISVSYNSLPVGLYRVDATWQAASDTAGCVPYVRIMRGDSQVSSTKETMPVDLDARHPRSSFVFQSIGEAGATSWTMQYRRYGDPGTIGIRDAGMMVMMLKNFEQ